jgi:hypothetical protein
MKTSLFLPALMAIIGLLQAQNTPSKNTAANLPTKNLLSEPGPTFRVNAGSNASFVAFGDQRFTDPKNVTVTDPRVREWLVRKIAEEKPAAVVLNGDVPYAGDNKNDYAVYLAESKPWRDAGLHVFPALGNHEFHGDPRVSLENWWDCFPELRNRRWYSAQLGPRVYMIALDTNASLLPGSDQARWIQKQIAGMPKSVDFVLFTMHHPPVADMQKNLEVNHNPRPNEIAFRDYLSGIAPKLHARILVSAGHIHNYERNVVDDVAYLVSGGGGARPVYVERTPDDKYQSIVFPVYHYVKLTLEKDRMRARMYRVADPEAKVLSVELKDTFDIAVK